MPRQRSILADYVLYLALRLVAMFVNMFSVEAIYHFAGKLADLWYRLDKRHRNRAIDHLRESFPDWDASLLDKTAQESFRSMVFLAIDVLLTRKLITYWRWRRYVALPQSPDILRLLTERAKGAVLVLGHLGGWEVAGYAMAALGFDGYAVARALDNPYLNDYLLGARQNTGLTILDKRGAMRETDRIFAGGHYIGLVADQDAGKSGVFVDFFGRQASSYKAPALVAMQYDVPLIIAYGRRVGRTFRFELGFEEAIYPDQWADKPDPLRWITQQYTWALERAIRRWPGQYLWTYRRWKTRPRSESAEQGAA